MKVFCSEKCFISKPTERKVKRLKMSRQEGRGASETNPTQIAKSKPWTEECVAIFDIPRTRSCYCAICSSNCGALEYSGIRKIWKSVLITCLLLQVPVWGVSPPDVFCKFPILSFFSQNKYKHPGVKSFLLLAASWQHVFPPWKFWLSPKSLSSCAPFSDGFFPIKLEFAKNHFVSEKKVFPALTLFLQSS